MAELLPTDAGPSPFTRNCNVYDTTPFARATGVGYIIAPNSGRIRLSVDAHHRLFPITQQSLAPQVREVKGNRA